MKYDTYMKLSSPRIGATEILEINPVRS